MTGEEFPGQPAEQVQSEFFLLQLPYDQKGSYEYRTAALKAEPGTRVLFQYANKIIADAVFDRVEKYAQPRGVYRGALHFDINSIRAFSPIGPEVMKAIWPDDFKRFGQWKTNLNPDRFSQFEQHLAGVRMPTPPPLDHWDSSFQDEVQQASSCTNEELLSRIADAPPLPERKAVTAKIFARNPYVAAFVLRRANGVCEQCGKPAPFLRKKDGTPYLEVHHKVRLADDGPDIVANAIALCPNCHRHAHCG